MLLLLSTFSSTHFLIESSSGVFDLVEHFGAFFHSLKPFGPSWKDTAKDWQTLIAGLAAFFPAFFAAVFVWRQLDQQRTQFMKAQEAAALKARLRLSRNVSHISRHLDQCYDLLISKDFSYDKHTLPAELLDDVLEACVTSSSNDFVFFQHYIEKTQTYASTCGAFEDIGGEKNLVNCFKMLGEIDVLTDRLYPFSRFEVEKVVDETVSINEVKSRLQHNLRRGKDISGTNLEEIFSLGLFDR